MHLIIKVCEWIESEAERTRKKENIGKERDANVRTIYLRFEDYRGFFSAMAIRLFNLPLGERRCPIELA